MRLAMADSITNNTLFQPERRSNLSYLFQYKTREGLTKTGFTLSKGSVSQVTMKKTLDHYVQSARGSDYFAVEMEYFGSDCMIKSADGILDSFNRGGFKRRDHYILVPKSEKYSPFQRLKQFLSAVNHNTPPR